MKSIQYLFLSIFCVIISLSLLPSATSAIVGLLGVFFSIKGQIEERRERKERNQE